MRTNLTSRSFRVMAIALGTALSLTGPRPAASQVGLASQTSSIQMTATMHSVATVSVAAASNGEVVTHVSMNSAAAPTVRVRLARHAPSGATLSVRAGDARTAQDISRNFTMVAPAASGEIVFTGGGKPGAAIPVEYEVTTPFGDSVARWFFEADILVMPAVPVAELATRD